MNTCWPRTMAAALLAVGLLASTAPPASPSAYWYYCPSAKAYYPNVPSCPEEWVKVPEVVAMPEKPAEPAPPTKPAQGPEKSMGQSTEERIKQLQREQKEQEALASGVEEERVRAVTPVIQGVLEKIRKSGIAFSAVGWGVSGVERNESCSKNGLMRLWSPVQIGIRVQGKHGTECITVEARRLESDAKYRIWVYFYDSSISCKEVEIESPQTDVVYEAVLKFINKAVDPTGAPCA